MPAFMPVGTQGTVKGFDGRPIAGNRLADDFSEHISFGGSSG